MISLYRKEIEDEYLRKNFERLENYINREPLLKGEFTFFTLVLTAASYPSTVSYRHNLGFTPRDALVTSNTNTGAYTLEFADFSKTDIKITITGPVELRLFLGTYSEGRTV